MSKADEMLSNLGYMCMKKDEENIIWTLYAHDYKYEIDFKLKYKEVLYKPIFRKTGEILDNGGISMQELQAINLKCKEVGWIE